jgi:hypothetical protein
MSWNAPVPEYVYSQEPWDVDTISKKLKETTKVAMDGDPVVTELMKRLQNYNHKSRTSKVTSKVVEAGVSIATWATPGFLIPLAFEAAGAAYVMATGGTEEHKLIKELYYDKRLESRWRTINEEAQLALSQYQAALASHNGALLACSESVLTQLVGSENIGQVLGKTFLCHKVIGKHPIETAANTAQSVQ